MQNRVPRTLCIILVSTDRHASFLGPCLESLPAACESVAYRILVVDNDGEGATSRVAQAYAGRLPIQVIHQSRPRGFAANVNTALQFVGEPFVLLLNVDTELPPGSVAQALKRLQSFPDAGALSVRLIGPGGQPESSARAYPTPLQLFWEQSGLARLFPRSRVFGRSRLYYVEQKHVLEVDWSSGAFLLLRTEAVQQIGGLDESFFLYSEDTDLCFRLRQAGWKIVFDPSVTVFHWKDPLRVANRRFTFVQTHRSLIRFWQKHGTTGTVLAVRLVLFLGLLGRFLTSPLLLRRGRRYFADSLSAYGEVLLFILGLTRSGTGQPRPKGQKVEQPRA